MWYVYLINGTYYYHDFPPRKLQAYLPGIEYLGQVKQLSQVNTLIGNVLCEPLILPDTVPVHIRAQEKETQRREKIRHAKLGDRNPNKKGLSEAHRQKIRQTMQGYNRGSDNVNFGKPRRRDIRAKISQTKRQNAQTKKYRWAVSPEGTEHLLCGELPAGYVWGRKRFVIKVRRSSLGDD
jgi:hypothetical protein